MRKIIFFVFLLSLCQAYAAVNENPQGMIREEIDELFAQRLIPGKIGTFRTFYLEDGNVFHGRIKYISEEGNVTLQTSEGVILLPYEEILEETVEVTKKDGTKLNGKLIEEDDLKIVLLNRYGKFNVPKAQIDKLDRFYGGQPETKLVRKRFFVAEEELTALFSDPTAFILKPYTFYITGFSMGYGINERVQLFSRIPNNFSGDINLFPRVIIFRKHQGAVRNNIAVGFSVFSNHRMINEYAKYYDEKPVEEIKNSSYSFSSNKDVFKAIYGDKKKFFWDASVMFSRRMPLRSGRGNWSFHAGTTVNQLLFEKPETEYQGVVLTGGFSEERFNAWRIFSGIDYDLTQKIKFIAVAFYDPGNRYMSVGESLKNYLKNGFVSGNFTGVRREFDFDFGVTFAPDENLRIGIHFQQPFFTIYWKFFDY